MDESKALLADAYDLLRKMHPYTGGNWKVRDKCAPRIDRWIAKVEATARETEGESK